MPGLSLVCLVLLLGLDRQADAAALQADAQGASVLAPAAASLRTAPGRVPVHGVVNGAAWAVRTAAPGMRFRTARHLALSRTTAEQSATMGNSLLRNRKAPKAFSDLLSCFDQLMEVRRPPRHCGRLAPTHPFLPHTPSRHPPQRKGLDYYIVSGTLLGQQRMRNFIPYDSDVDVTVHSEDKVHGGGGGMVG